MISETVQDVDVHKRGHLDYLDGWRGLAILMVLCGHFLPNDFINLGTTGVDLFFVLSGRLMADILFVKKIALPQFFARRFSRVYPGLFVFVVLAGVLCDSFTRIKVGIIAALTALTFTSNYASILFHPTGLYDHIWSLCVEEHSYLVLGFLAWLARRKMFDARYILLFVASAAMINGIVQTAMGYDYNDVYWRSDVQCAPIFLSAFFYLLLRDKKIKYADLGCLSAFAATCFFKSALFGPAVANSLGIITLALSIACLDQACDAVKNALAFAPLRHMGIWSFSIYLWQQVFYQLDMLQTEYWHLPAAIVMGLMSFYLIECPVRAWLNREINRRIPSIA